ncbi:Electron transfer flavoprotein-ubiquinone oxidoreductase (ETF-QO) [Mucor velutinosus]|uniref:Electron transfer flavoprotein-ubiquinone oxidoreductase (ETF-QO) n=1 Tax=Mucor velutinosus TaxID=708070 RepID=A0AAN7D7A9_9FUNG|nr:Electron transfer flavoprotein-ubiquinone oxidoreductase (ETF-QO) [Mucor velutinosus]
MTTTTTPQKDNWSASNYAKHASFVPKLGSVILDKLNPQSNERILDFGCGDGVLTKILASRAQSVTGIDASQDMILRAQQDDPPQNTTYHTVNGYDLAAWFDSQEKTDPYDAVFSSATLHWLKEEPAKAIQNIYHILKPHGRFVAEFGGFMNCGEIKNALIHALNKRGIDGNAASPWFFPSAEHYSKMLAENGFQVQEAELVPRMTELDTDIKGWIETFGFAFLEHLSNDQERKQVAQEVQDYLQPSFQREDGKWVVMYVRLRVIAIKK